MLKDLSAFWKVAQAEETMQAEPPEYSFSI